MKEINQGYFEGERALYGTHEAKIVNCVFDNGESPLKESSNLELVSSMFKWKYPLWYCNNVSLKDCTWFDMARAGVWYTNNISVDNSVIEAPKNFRRCDNLKLKDVVFPNALETLWNCDHVEMNNVTAKGDYFGMGTCNIKADGFTLDGNYSFDGSKNVEIHNARMLSKDAFWNSENVTVYDSFISGEYLGWNSKNITLINCTIESLQGMCYIENLVMKNCKVINTTFAFELSTVDAELTTKIDSILNPKAGIIRVPEIGELIVETDKVDEAATKLECPKINKKSPHPDWIKE